MSFPHALMSLVCGGKKLNRELIGITNQFAGNTPLIYQDAPHLQIIPTRVMRKVPRSCLDQLRVKNWTWEAGGIERPMLGTFEACKYVVAQNVLTVAYKQQELDERYVEYCHIPLPGHSKYAEVADAHHQLSRDETFQLLFGRQHGAWLKQMRAIERQ